MSYFSDENFDQNLSDGSIEGVDNLAHLILIFGGGGDEKGIGVLIGDDVNLSDEVGQSAVGKSGVSAAATASESPAQIHRR